MASGSSLSGGGGGGGASVPTLQSADDAVQLIVYCGDDQQGVAQVLNPALIKLCKSRKGRGGELLALSAQNGSDPLQFIDPAKHSLGYLYFLASRCAHTQDPEAARRLLPLISNFAHDCDVWQIRLAPEKLTQLAQGIVQLADGLNDPALAMAPLSHLFVRFTHGVSSLTTLHPIVLYQYLRVRQYQAAVDNILTREILDADKGVSPLRYQDVLEYFYYGGLVYTRLKMHKQAIEFYEACVSAPSTVVSVVQMDAYKKMVLVQLLLEGKTSPPPKYTAGVLTRTFKTLAQPYSAFVAAYESRDRSKAAECAHIVEERKELFQKDCNLGLLHQCLALLRQRRIQRLTEIYSTLSLAEIASAVDVTGPTAEADVEKDVLDMVAKGWIYATIQPVSPADPSPVVRFEESPEQFNTTETIAKLAREMDEAVYWQNQVHERERAIARSHAFLTKQAHAAREPRFLGGYGAADEDGYEDDVFA